MSINSTKDARRVMAPGQNPGCSGVSLLPVFTANITGADFLQSEVSSGWYYEFVTKEGKPLSNLGNKFMVPTRVLYGSHEES
jgi:hypothetical protein